ncbi:Transglutaminase-like enzyme, putative cysteine protease [Rhizobiales bacterium GAS113]|nr:Transglutaminase-like enzyme, putative cysteine protease [Rhizobiales bacterium GAS113]
MLIRYGYDIELEFAHPASVITLMEVHPTRRGDIRMESPLLVLPLTTVEPFFDGFGNRCRRIAAPAGRIALHLEGFIWDSGVADSVNWAAQALPVSALPPDVLPFLLASRYCETDLLSEFAWSNFGHFANGWTRVQAVCDFVNRRLKFSYPTACSLRTASLALQERVGVCRDFAHLAVTLCRCLNIPARYCNGYLGDIGVPPDPAPMDFNAWFEAYLEGRWYTFDARHNQPRIGRILVARGRDAADVAMITSFGPHALTRFSVLTEETHSDPCLSPAPKETRSASFDSPLYPEHALASGAMK